MFWVCGFGSSHGGQGTSTSVCDVIPSAHSHHKLSSPSYHPEIIIQKTASSWVAQTNTVDGVLITQVWLGLAGLEGCELHIVQILVGSDSLAASEVILRSVAHDVDLKPFLSPLRIWSCAGSSRSTRNV
jgi:hypothetical protein